MSGSSSSIPDASPARAEPLGLTVHTLPEPRVEVLEARTASGRRRMLLIALVCALPVVASYTAYYGWRPTASAAYSTLIDPPRPLPDVAGQRLDGRPLPLRSVTGRWLLVVAHGSVCDTACERLFFLQRQLREMTGRDRDRVEKLWLVLDDAPVDARLRAALEASPAMQIVRVPRAAVAGWLQPAPGQALESHLYIVDPRGDWMMRAPAEPEPARLKGDLERLLRASSWWHRPGSPTPENGR